MHLFSNPYFLWHSQTYRTAASTRLHIFNGTERFDLQMSKTDIWLPRNTNVMVRLLSWRHSANTKQGLFWGRTLHGARRGRYWRITNSDWQGAKDQSQAGAGNPVITVTRGEIMLGTTQQSFITSGPGQWATLHLPCTAKLSHPFCCCATGLDGTDRREVTMLTDLSPGSWAHHRHTVPFWIRGLPVCAETYLFHAVIYKRIKDKRINALFHHKEDRRNHFAITRQYIFHYL